MKKILVTITRQQHSELIVPDDFPVSSEEWPPLVFDQMLHLQARASIDTTTTSISAELLEEDITSE